MSDATAERSGGMYPPAAPAETPRTRLRPFEVADAPFVLHLLNEPAFLRFIGDKGVRTHEDAIAYLRNGPIGSYARHGYGLWLVTDKATDRPVGMCGLVKRDALEDADLGYAFLETWWGRGLAVEAARAVIDHARALGLPRLLAIVSPGNARSVRVLERIGFAGRGATRLAAEQPEVLLFCLELGTAPVSGTSEPA